MHQQNQQEEKVEKVEMIYLRQRGFSFFYKNRRLSTHLGKIITVDKSEVEYFKSELNFVELPKQTSIKIKDPKILVCVPTYNRKFLLKETLKNLREVFKDHTIWFFDDHSDEFDEEWLLQFGDRVIRNHKNEGVRYWQAFIWNMIPREGYDYIYYTDSDSFHDPEAIDFMIDLSNKNFGFPVSGFFSPNHLEKTKEVEFIKDGRLGNTVAGISIFIPKKYMSCIETMNVPLPKAHYYIVAEQLPLVVHPLKSVVEHMGAGGVHIAKDDWYKETAIRPTKYLINKREEFLNNYYGDTSWKKS